MTARKNGPQPSGAVTEQSQSTAKPGLRIAVYGTAPTSIRLTVRRHQDYPTPALVLSTEEASDLATRLTDVLAHLEATGVSHEH